ncbi:hypothetical protein O181_097702 [Austropuccinia psidii MF-1]|uniref:Uncharacterized protein n=1 Tax=Austropuccinia psidii MF-1 TaxID=1389203 RepID=A0A9Q3J9S4_9BASI|nr:hypothetical protein [Austropuccinia psidii MF-1]
MDANTTNTSDMGPQKRFNSAKYSDMECSSSESIIAISTAIPNLPPELPEEIMHKSNIEAPHSHWASSTKISTEVLFGAEIEVITKEQFLNNSSQIAPILEGMSKDARISQYVREKLQKARELLVADIDRVYKKLLSHIFQIPPQYLGITILGVKLGNTLPPKSHVEIGKITNISSKKKFKPSKNQAKKKICPTCQLAPEVNEGESGALCPSANESNNGHPISTTNDYPVEIPDIGCVTNHHESIVPSPNLDTQEATNISNENISPETQRTVAEDEIVLTHQWIQLLVH